MNSSFGWIVIKIFAVNILKRMALVFKLQNINYFYAAINTDVQLLYLFILSQVQVLPSGEQYRVKIKFEFYICKGVLSSKLGELLKCPITCKYIAEEFSEHA